MINSADEPAPDPCELPSTFEVQSDPNVAPIDEYYERCYESIADRLNE